MTTPGERLAEQIRVKRQSSSEAQLTGINMDIEDQIGELRQTFVA